MRFKDISEQQFGLLTPKWPAGLSGRAVQWLCLCECGQLTLARGTSLRHREHLSCGCLRKNTLSIHGMYGTSELESYQDAKYRCSNPRHYAWESYGGRGIKFRFESFEQFFAEIGPRPAGLSLDRINNDGHYESGNVRWATRKEQAANRRPQPPRNKCAA